MVTSLMTRSTNSPHLPHQNLDVRHGADLPATKRGYEHLWVCRKTVCSGLESPLSAVAVVIIRTETEPGNWCSRRRAREVSSAATTRAIARRHDSWRRHADSEAQGRTEWIEQLHSPSSPSLQTRRWDVLMGKKLMCRRAAKCSPCSLTPDWVPEPYSCSQACSLRWFHDSGNWQLRPTYQGQGGIL